MQGWRPPRGPRPAPISSLLEAILLSLVPKVGLGAAKIHNLRTAVPVLLHLDALPAIVGVRHSYPPANDAPTLQGAVVALVADVNLGAWPDERVADDALSVALLAETPDGDPWLLPAHDQVWMVLRHAGRQAN